jgi:hypothetical protein
MHFVCFLSSSIRSNPVQHPVLRRGNDASATPPVYLESYIPDMDFFPAQRDYYERVHQHEADFVPLDQPHVAAHIRDVSEFEHFLKEYNDENLIFASSVEDRRVFRTLIFEETTIDFPTLSRVLVALCYIRTIIFDRVNIHMSSWRCCSEQMNVYGRSRTIRFQRCRFLEDASYVSCPREDFRVPLSLEEEHIRTTKTPKRFYRNLVMASDLIYVDVHSGTILLSSSNNVSASPSHFHVVLCQECMPLMLPLGK